MIEITLTIKKETLNVGLDVLTEISLGTDDPDIVRQCEEIRASLSEGSEQISGEGKEVLQRLTAKRGNLRINRKNKGDGMIFDIQYKEPKVYDGYAIAGEILCGPDIIERIKDVARFTYTDHSSIQVVDTIIYRRQRILSGMADKISVKDYYYPSKNVIATTDSRYPNTILVNRKNVWKYEVVDYIRNGAHEAGHCPFGYGHGSNWPQNTWKGRMMRRLNGDTEDMYQSVPCLLEELVLQLAKEKKMV